MYISEIDKLLLKLEIEFPQKSKARIIEEKKYQQIYAARDNVINKDNNPCDNLSKIDHLNEND